MPGTSEEECKRTESINELYQTEKRYLSRLQTINKLFYEPSKLVLGDEDRQVIFQNLPELIEASQKMLITFEVAKAGYIGDLFLKNMELLNVLRSYCIGHSEANERLLHSQTTYKRFHKLITDSTKLPECESLDLASFLLEPVQRLTRYPLLLRQILHYTPKNNEDHIPVTNALIASETLLKSTNEAVRAFEDRVVLKEIQSRLEKGYRGDSKNIFTGLFGRSEEKSCIHPEKLINFDLVSDTAQGVPRELVHSGEALFGSEKKRCKIFLFNDILLFAKPHKDSSLELLASPIQLESLKFEQSNSAGTPTLEFHFELFPEDLRIVEPTKLILKFEEETDLLTWLHELKTAQQKLKSSGFKKFNKPAMQSFIGSMSLQIISASNLDTSGNRNRPVLCSATIGYNSGTTSTRPGPNPLWMSEIILPVSGYFEELELHVFAVQKFSSNLEIGRSIVPLDFLEYYANKSTDVMKVDLVSRGRPTGSQLMLQIFFRLF